MRYLCIVPYAFPFFRVDLTVLFGRGLAELGMQGHWYAPPETPGPPRHVSWGGGMALVGRRLSGSGLLTRLANRALDLVHELAACTRILAGGYDFVQSRDLFLSPVFTALCCRLARIRFYYWLSYPFPEDRLHRARSGMSAHPRLDRLRGALMRFSLYRLILPLADHVFVQSERMRDDLQERGVSPERMTVVPMGVDEALVDRLPRDAEPPAGTGPVVLYTGIFFRVRRVEFVLRAFALALERVDDARLVMVGRAQDAAYEAELRREAERLGIAHRVEFTGFLPAAEVLDRVAEARVCLSLTYPTPVLDSTSPTKLVEYMAVGRASVVNEHPEQQRLMEQSGGGLCVPWDEQAVADAVVRLLEHPDEARQMGERAREFALRERAYGVIARNLFDTYQQLAAARREP